MNRARNAFEQTSFFLGGGAVCVQVSVEMRRADTAELNATKTHGNIPTVERNGSIPAEVAAGDAKLFSSVLEKSGGRGL